ncbi:unnamed protein product [Auanema sp. JU1783]|nr:unnamed protein product [Auanema sp. JU1783]
MWPWLMTACIYPCIVGPDFWGLVHKEWKMCTAGQLQSPINIEPDKLLFDPHLDNIKLDDVQIEASFENIGQLPIVTLNETKQTINITGGPAFPYNYRLNQIIVHYGKDSNEKGSEHTVNRERFPAEVQFLAYNSDLYVNFTQAMTQPKGLLAIAIMVDIGSTTEVELRRLTVASQSITYKGQTTILRRLHPYALLPKTSHYVTYEGSLTFPGCHETVTWIIMNNPIYITKEDLSIWNELQKAESKQSQPVYMTPTYRPLRNGHGRTVRTNINIAFKPQSSSTCVSNRYTDLGYRANPHRSTNSQHNHSLYKRNLLQQENDFKESNNNIELYEEDFLNSPHLEHSL